MAEQSPSQTFHVRLVRALQRWEVDSGRVGRGGNQAALHRLLLDRFGNAAPSKEALSKWSRGDYVPTLDYCWMLSQVLAVSPAWMAFGDGAMTATESDDMSKPRKLGPLDLAVLQRINEARARHLHHTGDDLYWIEIASAMGWSQPTVSAIANAKRALRLEEIPKLAEVLHVRPAWLAFGDGQMLAATPSPAAALAPVPFRPVESRPADRRKRAR